MLNTDDFVIALDYDQSTCSYSVNSTKSSSTPINANTTIHIQVYKADVLCFTTYGSIIYAKQNRYKVEANFNLTAVDSSESTAESNINGTITMMIGSTGIISIEGSYVCENTISFTTYGISKAKALTRLIKLYKGFTSNANLFDLFKYNYFSIIPQNSLNTVIQPFEVIYKADTDDVYFYYIYQDAIVESGPRYLKCDCYSVKNATYTNTWSKQILA